MTLIKTIVNPNGENYNIVERNGKYDVVREFAKDMNVTVALGLKSIKKAEKYIMKRA